MFKVYILKNSATGKHYIGSTNDFVRRLTEHNRGQTKSTRTKGIWKVIYTEDFDTALEAKRREKQIKSYKGGNAFRKLFMRG
jgi:putative endonuclease